MKYARRRPGFDADLTGHPRDLGIKEDVVLEAVREFMAQRLFGPDRLRLLSDELAASLGDEPQSIEADRKRLVCFSSSEGSPIFGANAVHLRRPEIGHVAAVRGPSGPVTRREDEVP